MADPFTAIDLFCGAGGVTTGYKAAEVKVLAAVDIDASARASFAANHPEVRLFDDDMHYLQPAELMTRIRLHRGTLGILTACAPCQSFSSLSREQKPGDSRPRLVTRIGDFVEKIRPAAVVVENVPKAQGSWHFRRLTGRLRSAGYGIWHGVVYATDFGVPQHRRRVVLIGLRDVQDDKVCRLLPTAPPLASLAESRTVKDAFAGLEINSEDVLHKPRTSYPPKILQRIQAIPQNGGSWKDLPADLQLECHRKLERSAAGSSYGRMRWDKAAPTLTTRCVTPACGRFLHPSEDRPITLREAALLQTFPRDYIFKGGATSIEAQIGNAVPPRLAQAIAMLVVDALLWKRRGT